MSLKELYQHLCTDFEKKKILLFKAGLKQAKFNQKEAAKLLGVKRTTFLMFCRTKKIPLKGR